jgi:hypothetical protein
MIPGQSSVKIWPNYSYRTDLFSLLDSVKIDFFETKPG